MYTEDVSDLSLVQIELQYSAEDVGLYAIQKGFLLDNFPGSEIFIDQENSSNTILITIGVGGGGSSSSGLNGTGALCKISFSALSTNGSDITITQSEFRDKDNNAIGIVDVVHGRVEIK